MKFSTTIALCVFFAAAGARTVYAQSGIDTSTKDKVATTILRGSYFGTFGVQMFEARSTIDALKWGANEVNPVMAPVSSHSAGIIAACLGRAAMIDLATHTIARRNKVAAIVFTAG